jgi:hypothetical protein
MDGNSIVLWFSLVVTIIVVVCAVFIINEYDKISRKH